MTPSNTGPALKNSSAMNRSPNRTHDRDTFFKYMSADTARQVLSNRTLRWSSPLLFNDPFDVPRKLCFGVTPTSIVNASARQMAEFIEYPPADTSHLRPKIRLIVEAVKNGIFPKVKAKLLAATLDASASPPTSEHLDELRRLWQTWIPNMRILCLTESADHFAMWLHYADKYKGVVLELRCVDELDSVWLTAQRVKYEKQKPDVYTAEGWAALLALPNEMASQRMLHIATYSKAADWSYENEWRLLSFKRPMDTGHFTDYKFHPQELAGIYMGPLISPDARKALILLAANYPNIKYFDVSLGMSRELLYTEFSPPLESNGNEANCPNPQDATT